ncbi:hypothetical protein [Mesorhizobium sp. B2-4-9]|uniref:hypothetical protein n=1 Tax=Mesorhizobium sp. B2-4-9 TaxID=2589940 RepID=UPI001AEEEE28|nr:hypothetical protein [Mesorhizobium sp. B2-4-9]
MLTRMLQAVAVVGMIWATPQAFADSLQSLPALYAKYDVTDAALIKDLPGFKTGGQRSMASI